VTRLRALVTAPLRGDGLDKLREFADVVYDPWIDHTPLRIYSAEQLAERASSESADVLVVESDSVSGPVFDLPLRAIAATRGDPNNVDVPGATKAVIPVLYTPGRNADAVAEMAIALLFAATRHLITAMRMSGRARRFATARSPTDGSGRGRWQGKPPASSGSAPSPKP